MKQRLNKEQAESAAEALLSQEPRFRDNWLGRLLKRSRLRPVRRAMWDQEGISKMPEPTGFESPGSPLWGVMHPHRPFD